MNDEFDYRGGVLHAEGVSLEALAAEHGTPSYVYSRASIERAWRGFDSALAGQPHLVCYAVKANGNLAVLDVLARLGSGFDIVSAGELERVIAAGGDPGKTVFAGVGKSRAEMERALAAGVRGFNVESPAELERLAAVATATGTTARVSLRVNPDVDARTHPYISTGLRDNKFGIPIDEAPALYEVASRMGGLEVAGVDCHIGSQLTDIAPLLAAMDRVLALVDTVAAAGIRLHHVNLGGGMGVRYRDESPPEPRRYAREILDRVASRDLELLLEPGRAVVAGAGVLLTRVEYLKRNGDRHFAVVDAAMNDLLRPALYSAWHDIVPVSLAAPTGVVRAEAEYDVVGPVCESSDFLGKGRRLALAAGDLLAVCTAGAYGAVMGSNYNARPRPPELLVDGTGTLVARRRETVADLFRLERRLPG